MTEPEEQHEERADALEAMADDGGVSAADALESQADSRVSAEEIDFDRLEAEAQKEPPPDVDPFSPEALPAADAISLYADRAARLFAWSGFQGRLAVGEPADLVVLDRDPIETKPDDLRSIQVLATYVAGHETFRRHPAP